MILAYLAAILLWLSIIVYATLGGADFGGGVWSLLTRRQDVRDLIVGAIGPVWEANNVWIIFLIVGLYVAFPDVSATLSIALFLPFSLALLGIVMRGASFVFQTHFERSYTVSSIWGRSFSAASTITPFLFGAAAAAVASGQIRVSHGLVTAALIGAWLTPFALTTGVLGIGLCAILAAIFLTVEAEQKQDEKLVAYFRTRSYLAGLVTALVGLVDLLLAPSEAPVLWQGMLDHALWAVIVTMLIGIATFLALVFRRYKLARLLIGVETGAFLGTWGLAQLPYIVPPDMTVAGTASPPATLMAFLVSAMVGMLVLIPSLWFLFHVFKAPIPTPPIHEKEVEQL